MFEDAQIKGVIMLDSFQVNLVLKRMSVKNVGINGKRKTSSH
jgi:hypothetical protein